MTHVSVVPQLDRIIAEGTQPSFQPVEDLHLRKMLKPSNRITCVDGFALSVIAGWGTHCFPCDEIGSVFPGSGSFDGPYEQLEVVFPTERPEPWDVWREYCEDPDDPTETVYGYQLVA